MTDRFDFHLHTCRSDGVRSPTEALALAARAGLAGISITDHDTVEAYTGLELPRSPRLLPGIEVSASHEGVEIHILGYFPSGLPAGIGDLVRDLLAERSRRIRDGVRRLAEKGISLSWSDVLGEAAGGVVSRGHLAQLLVRKRFVPSVSAAFPDLLGPEMVRPPAAKASEVVAEILRLRGIPVWAHPNPGQAEAFLPALVEAGLAGIEVLTGGRRPAEERRLRGLLEGRRLLVTGGSDWHGREGETLGQFAVTAAEVGEFLGAIGW